MPADIDPVQDAARRFLIAIDYDWRRRVVLPVLTALADGRPEALSGNPESFRWCVQRRLVDFAPLGGTPMISPLGREILARMTAPATRTPLPNLDESFHYAKSLIASAILSTLPSHRARATLRSLQAVLDAARSNSTPTSPASILASQLLESFIQDPFADSDETSDLNSNEPSKVT